MERADASIPDDHALRVQLNDEVHARPPEELVAPSRISFLAMVADWGPGNVDLEPLHQLAEHFGAPGPTEGLRHYSEDFGPFRIKWERHSEFARYKFIVDKAKSLPFAETAISLLPPEWLKALPGQVIAATHVELRAGKVGAQKHDQLAKKYFAGNVLVGASVAGGQGTGFTDFRIHEDGFSRLLIFDDGLTRRQAGRTMQRLLEIDTYRLMALLALPVAQDLGPFLNQCERELDEITTAMTVSGEEDEPELLDRITRLAASVESRHSDTHFRLSAANAYYGIVRQRIREIRESRIQGLQTFQEFTERRLSPAMNTCIAVSERQRALSERVAQATRLLSTRVEITTEKQNRALLESMNRRAELQLRLQQTVEGLSVAAITYYIVSLVGYAADILPTLGIDVEPKLVMAASIPVVVAMTALGVRRIRRRISPGSG